MLSSFRHLNVVSCQRHQLDEVQGGALVCLGNAGSERGYYCQCLPRQRLQQQQRCHVGYVYCVGGNSGHAGEFGGVVKNTGSSMLMLYFLWYVILHHATKTMCGTFRATSCRHDNGRASEQTLECRDEKYLGL